MTEPCFHSTFGAPPERARAMNFARIRKRTLELAAPLSGIRASRAPSVRLARAGTRLGISAGSAPFFRLYFWYEDRHLCSR